MTGSPRNNAWTECTKLDFLKSWNWHLKSTLKVKRNISACYVCTQYNVLKFPLSKNTHRLNHETESSKPQDLFEKKKEIKAKQVLRWTELSSNTFRDKCMEYSGWFKFRVCSTWIPKWYSGWSWNANGRTVWGGKRRSAEVSPEGVGVAGVFGSTLWRRVCVQLGKIHGHSSLFKLQESGCKGQHSLSQIRHGRGG